MGDKNNIWNLVKELLHEHDCVIVPGFGGFVCNREPAKIDQVSNLVTPPAKQVVFNQNLKVNDGLLASRTAEKLGLTYIEAVRFIDAHVNEAKEILQEKKHLLIELFGSFRLNADANYVFQPDKFNNYLIASYGLMPAQANPVASRAVKHTRILRNRKPFEENKTKNTTIWPKVLISTLVILLTVNGWIFLRKHAFNEIHVGNISAMSITTWFDSLFHKETKTTEKMTPPVATVDSQTSTISHIDSADPEAVMATVEPYEDATPVTDTTIKTETNEPIVSSPTEEIESPSFNLSTFGQNLALARPYWYIPASPNTSVETQTVNENELPVLTSDTSFHVITGVFCKQRNVKRYLNAMQAKGYHAELLSGSGKSCTRISLGQFHSRLEAETFLSTVRSSENPDAWLLAQSN